MVGVFAVLLAQESARPSDVDAHLPLEFILWIGKDKCKVHGQLSTGRFDPCMHTCMHGFMACMRCIPMAPLHIMGACMCGFTA
eukprot:361758-Chlamydomonas_euryale.AAC.6